MNIIVHLIFKITVWPILKIYMNALNSIETKIAEEYWKRKFKDSVPYNYLTPFVDKTVVEYSQLEKKVLKTELNKESHEKIKAMCNNSETLLFTFYLSIIKILLYRYSNTNRIIVGGTSISEMDSSSDDNVLLLYNTEIEIDHSFKQIFSKVKDELINSHNHQFLSIDNIADVFDDENKENLMRVGFFMEGITKNTVTKNEFEFSLTLSKQDDKLYLNASFNTDMLNPILVSGFLNNFNSLVESILKSLYEPVGVLDLLDESYVEQLKEEFNNTSVSFTQDASLWDLFRDSANTYKDQKAIILGDKYMTYAELLEASSTLANLMMSKGLQSGDRIGLLTERNFDMIIGMLAILRTGCIYVPIDPKYPQERQSYILSNSGIKWVLTDSLPDDRILTDLDEIIVISDYQRYKGESFKSRGAANDLAYVIYTSGSTGQPKGVMIKHLSAINLVEWVNKEFDVSQKDKFLLLSSMCFDLSVYDIFGSLFAGASLVIIEEEKIKDPEQLLATIEKEKITIWNSVPSTMNHLIKYFDVPEFNQHCKKLRLVLMSGDWIPVSLPLKIGGMFPNAVLISLGGATEGTVWSNYFPIGAVDQLWRSIPYGKPIANNAFYILDEQLNAVPHGAIGELVIGGHGVAAGYDNDPIKTRRAFLPDPFSSIDGAMMYKTGDLGRMKADWNMEILGRKDHQVKIRGFRVETGEIENVFLLIEEVSEIVVIDRQNEEGIKYLIAFYVSAKTISSEQAKEFLARYLPDYMIPSYFVKLEILPLNSNGKIDRKSLPEITRESSEIILPTNEVESYLKIIWVEQLGINDVSTTEDFFEIGGNSLFATRLISEIYSKYKVRLGLERIFEYPTIKSLATLISNDTSVEQKEIPQLLDMEHYEISHEQQRIWVVSQFIEASVAYNIPGAYTIKGALNIDAFINAFKELIRKYEVLRTSFELVGKDPKQIVHAFKEEACDITFIDLSHVINEEHSIYEELKRNVNKPFDLSKGFLIRVLLIKSADNEYKCGITFHHIIADLRSLDLLMSEIIQFYELLASGNAIPDPKLRIQYKDYAAWRNEQISGGELLIDKQYWLTQFSDGISKLELPYDFPKETVKSNKGATIEIQINNKNYEQLINFSKEKNTTNYIVLMSIVNLLLFKYSHQKDITIGTPVNGRDHQDIENQIGIFLSTIAVRNKIDAQVSVSQFIDTVSQNILNAFKHQRYPYDLILNDLKKIDNNLDVQLFDVWVAYADQLNHKDNDDHLIEVTEYSIDNDTSKFDLSFLFFNDGEQILCMLEYDSNLFERSTIELMKFHFEQILKIVIEQPESLLNNFLTDSFIENDAEERFDLPFDFN